MPCARGNRFRGLGWLPVASRPGRAPPGRAVKGELNAPAASAGDPAKRKEAGSDDARRILAISG